VRIIRSIYPPIDLFEDIADPADWPLLISAEQKTNPRLIQTIGNIDLVPQERRVGGPGASYLMAPFTHVGPDRWSQFSDGNFGVLYVGNQFEVAMRDARSSKLRVGGLEFPSHFKKLRTKEFSQSRNRSDAGNQHMSLDPNFWRERANSQRREMSLGVDERVDQCDAQALIDEEACCVALIDFDRPSQANSFCYEGLRNPGSCRLYIRKDDYFFIFQICWRYRRLGRKAVVLGHHADHPTSRDQTGIYG
jgi:hypothetical protein